MANLIDKINAKQVRKDIPEFRVGNTVRVNVWVKEGTFSVRKKSGGIGVTRIFPVNAPTIDSIVVVKKGMVRRAKLNFVSGMKKDYKVKERN